MKESEAKDVRKVVADRYRVGDETDILALNKMEYGSADILATSEDFNWRFSQNPAGQAIISVIRDCSSGSVVGFIWIVPLRIRINGQCRLAAVGTDLVVHPEYRNTFAYAKLMRRFQQVFEDYDIPLHFSFLSEKAYRRQREQNPQTVSTIPLLVKPLDFKGLFQTYFFKNWQRLTVGWIGWLMSLCFFRHRQVASGSEVKIQVIDKFNHHFDEFWLKVRDKYPVIVIRDRAFLAWRFAEVSKRRYHFLVATRGDEMLGYVVLRCSNIRGVKTGLMMDFLVVDGGLGETAGAFLMAEAEAFFRSQEMSLAVGLMVSSAVEYLIMRRAGYARLPEPLAPRAFRFAFYIHNTNVRDLTSLSTQEWFITLADNESF